MDSSWVPGTVVICKAPCLICKQPAILGFIVTLVR